MLAWQTNTAPDQSWGASTVTVKVATKPNSQVKSSQSKIRPSVFENSTQINADFSITDIQRLIFQALHHYDLSRCRSRFCDFSRLLHLSFFVGGRNPQSICYEDYCSVVVVRRRRNPFFQGLHFRYISLSDFNCRQIRMRMG